MVGIDKDSKYYNHIFTVATFGRFKRFIHEGCFGSGKTYSCCMGLGLLCSNLEDLCITGLTIILCGRTKTTVKSNMGDVLAEQFGEDFKYTTSKKLDGKTKDAVLFSQNIHIKGFDDGKAEELFRGISNVFCVLHDECTLCNPDDLKYLLGRLRGEWDKYNFPEGICPGFYVGSCNPEGPTNHIKKLIDSPKYNSLKWNMHNACWNGADEYYAGLMEDYKDNPLMYKRYLLGLWVSAEGQIYASFDPDKHILSSNDYSVDFKGFDRIIMGVDVGSNHPTAIVVCGVDSGTYVVLETYRYQRTPLSDIALNIAKIFDRVRSSGAVIDAVYVDPAAASMRDELLKNGINSLNARNEHIEGIRCIDTLYARDRLYIMDTCTELIDEIGSYVWKESKSGKDEINKINDDCCDAKRYCIYSDVKRHE